MLFEFLNNLLQTLIDEAEKLKIKSTYIILIMIKKIELNLLERV